MPKAYAPEFRRKVLDLLAAGRPVAQLAQDLDISDLLLLCAYHHDICVHRLGWTLTLHPDGTTEARSPDGTQTLHSHGPPPTTRAG